MSGTTAKEKPRNFRELARQKEENWVAGIHVDKKTRSTVWKKSGGVAAQRNDHGLKKKGEAFLGTTVRGYLALVRRARGGKGEELKLMGCS